MCLEAVHICHMEGNMKSETTKKWDKRFMDVAELVGSWSSCFKESRHVGSVITKNNRILATGYNGAPSGVKNCKERGECMRVKLGIPSGTRLEMCYGMCAEQNAIAQAAKLGVSVEGGTIYVTHRPCPVCTRQIINAGIKRIVYKNDYPNEFSLELIKEAGIKLEHFED